ncbi:Aste57867_9370 [Aphanomyces stellatus]|uniref:Aste57867_9370 protein n=1 Tax=Aphanomyces stellatus TaxID=120398 RepID=A0A485KN16_9STRA|nr:hypothetical protein As57867_009334 [Aphanomyces stellatus]VFT86251.1 Aste57867_9370 [Aphanomyces stellatus]
MTNSIATGFVRKLYRMLDEEDTSIIGWETSGTHFTIRDADRLDATVLHKYYRGKLNAFRQQLANHGFVGDASAAMETYHHDCFIRGQPSLLGNIVCVKQPPIKVPSQKRSKKAATKDKARDEPYPTLKKPAHVPSGSEEELVWEAMTRFLYPADDKTITFNPASLANIPGFTPSIVQLTLDDAPPPATHNPLFAKSANPLFAAPFQQPFPPQQHAPNPLFAKAPPASMNPLFQKTTSTPTAMPSPPSSNPLFNKQISNPLFDKSATPTSFGFGAPSASAAKPTDAKSLFHRNNSIGGGGDQWQHLVSSSVDRFMQFSDTFASPEDTFKFILDERKKLDAEKSKLPPVVDSDTLFAGLSSQAPDALLSFLMGSSVDLLQKSVDTFEMQHRAAFTATGEPDDEDDDLDEDDDDDEQHVEI